MKNPVIAVKDYLQSSIGELRKVTWPSRETTIRYSAIVIVVSISVAAIFATLDFGFSRLVAGVIYTVKGAPTAPVAPEAPITPEVTPIDIDTTGDGSAEVTPIDAVGADSGEDLPSGETPTPSGDTGGITLPPIQ